jgi:hypothetical protein
MNVDFAQFCEDFDVAVTVHSRNRADVLAKRTDRLLHGYHLFHSGPGYDERQYNCVSRHQMPASIVGLGMTKNYVLRQMKQNIVVMFDDDVARIGWTASDRYAWLTAEQVQLMIINLVVNALDLGAGVFGISENDIRKTSPLKPFRFRAVVGAVIGIVGRESMFDERNQLKVRGRGQPVGHFSGGSVSSGSISFRRVGDRTGGHRRMSATEMAPERRACSGVGRSGGTLIVPAQPNERAHRRLESLGSIISSPQTSQRAQA